MTCPEACVLLVCVPLAMLLVLAFLALREVRDDDYLGLP